ncbi:MAG: GNAT family N-acetyltransferase [Oscillospiraceae bacterium]|nr:GNAT family N-acetyltransferase [Oscillospiraceae bacterium]
MKRERIIESERLYLREMEQTDYPALCKILQDEEVMYAYEHAFTGKEAQEWLDRQLKRYEKDGFGLWAAVLKETGEMIGQCGLTWQPCGGRQVLEIGYLFQKAYWHRGYAAEAAAACKKYAFEVLDAAEVFSIIRDDNLPSQKVAESNGMNIQGELVKHYYGQEMRHLIFCAGRAEGHTADGLKPCAAQKGARVQKKEQDGPRAAAGGAWPAMEEKR